MSSFDESAVASWCLSGCVSVLRSESRSQGMAKASFRMCYPVSVWGELFARVVGEGTRPKRHFVSNCS